MATIGEQVDTTLKDINGLIESYEGKLDILHELQSACKGIGDTVKYDFNEDGSVKVDPKGENILIHSAPKQLLYNKRGDDIPDGDRQSALAAIRKTFKGLSE